MPASSTRSSTQRSRSEGSYSIKVKKVADIQKSRSWAIYGRAGTGKTTFASTFPKPLLLVDVRDEGTDSISDVEGIDVMEAGSWEELEDLYWYLKTKGKGKYKTVVIDTVTQVQQLLVEEISSLRASKMDKAPGDWGTMKQSDWGDIAAKMKVWITNLRSLPLEVVFLAQDRVFQSETNDDDEEHSVIDPEVGPRLSPSISAHLCSVVSVIAHTLIRETVKKVRVNGKLTKKKRRDYCLRLGPNAYYVTKFRKPRDIELPEFLTNPSFEKTLKLISGEN